MRKLILFFVIISSIQNVFSSEEAKAKDITTEQIAIDSMNGSKNFVPRYSLDPRMALAYLGQSTCHVFNKDKTIKASFSLNFEEDGSTIQLDKSTTCQAVEGQGIVCSLNSSDYLAIDLTLAMGLSSSSTATDFFAVGATGVLVINNELFTAECVSLTNLH